MKKCGRCRQLLPLTSFSRNKSNSDGLNNRCRCCVAKHHSEVRKRLPELSASRLRELLNYDPETGIFTRKSLPECVMLGSIDRQGYCRISVDGRSYRAHRLVWMYVTGKWPDKEIDHRNSDKGDNRFVNLRLATRTQNNANAGIRQDNKLGVKGVHYDHVNKKYRAQIQINGKGYKIGRFHTIEEAHRAYSLAAVELFGEFARVA